MKVPSLTILASWGCIATRSLIHLLIYWISYVSVTWWNKHIITLISNDGMFKFNAMYLKLIYILYRHCEEVMLINHRVSKVKIVWPFQSDIIINKYFTYFVVFHQAINEQRTHKLAMWISHNGAIYILYFNIKHH